MANAFALIWVSIACVLINYASRMYLNNRAITLNTLRLWHSLCAQRLAWNIPIQHFLLLLVFMLVTAAPSALWAGALTPVPTTSNFLANITIPGYANTSRYTTHDTTRVRSSLGHFSYSPGTDLQGWLLVSAASATTVDGSVRQHEKLDYSRFTYNGRSYGIGASVGLTDGLLRETPLNLGYSFTETGFRTNVNCAKNRSSEFRVAEVPNGGDEGDLIWTVSGPMPNSPDLLESSRYVGYSTNEIVALGTTSTENLNDPRRVLAIAANASGHWGHLDRMQCLFSFHPTRFDVSVSIVGRNMTVTPLGDAAPFANNSMTFWFMRELNNVSTDQTSLYESLTANSLNSSITDYITSQGGNISLQYATVPGLENAFVAMMDDVLVSIASAQIMIANETVEHSAVVSKSALRLGNRVYIFIVFGINLLVISCFVVEAARTRLWQGMGAFDYMDPADLLLGCANRDGLGISSQDVSCGNVKVARREGQLLLSTWLQKIEDR